MLKLTTEKHEALRGLSATAELLVSITLTSCHVYFICTHAAGIPTVCKTKKNIKLRYRLTDKTLKDMLWHPTNSHRPSYFVVRDDVRVIDIIKPQ